jgi:cold shock CspA family protein
MQTGRKSGKLTTWKDDRGFGFIQPDDGGKDVFLHISALRNASRRPQVGDTILYEIVLEAEGKVRAVNASIQGVPSQSVSTRSKQRNSGSGRPRKTRRNSFGDLALGLAILAAAIFGIQKLGSKDMGFTVSDISQEPSAPPSGCNIKGNISISSGRKWYHVPGMEDYENTVIDTSRGERWFCSEEEARRNGWQRAPK